MNFRCLRSGLKAAALMGAASVFVHAECVPFQDAKRLEGKTACVTGQVLKVVESQSGNWFLDFCENYRECAFTVFVPRSDAQRVGDLTPLQGQQIEIYGKVQPYNGRSEIILKDKRQLEGERKKYVPPDEDGQLSICDGQNGEIHEPPHHLSAAAAPQASEQHVPAF